jgi:hypothetical protein
LQVEDRLEIKKYENIKILQSFNPLNAELSPICHLLALLVTHPTLHASRIGVIICIIFCHLQLLLLEGEYKHIKVKNTNVTRYYKVNTVVAGYVQCQ